MIQNEGARIWVNRVFAFLAGGLVVLAIMAFAFVTPLRNDKESLTEQLDDAQNGAARLLAEAKEHVESKSYDNAIKTLNTLFQKQPGSSEVVEGRKLEAEISVMVQANQENWEAAVAEIRAAWEKARAAEILSKADEDRQLVETGLSETLVKEWDKAKDKIRQDWEKQ